MKTLAVLSCEREGSRLRSGLSRCLEENEEIFPLGQETSREGQCEGQMLPYQPAVAGTEAVGCVQVGHSHAHVAAGTPAPPAVTLIGPWRPRVA